MFRVKVTVATMSRNSAKTQQREMARPIAGKTRCFLMLRMPRRWCSPPSAKPLGGQPGAVYHATMRSPVVSKPSVNKAMDFKSQGECVGDEPWIARPLEREKQRAPPKGNRMLGNVQVCKAAGLRTPGSTNICVNCLWFPLGVGAGPRSGLA
jgi:hypothetical protein